MKRLMQTTAIAAVLGLSALALGTGDAKAWWGGPWGGGPWDGWGSGRGTGNFSMNMGGGGWGNGYGYPGGWGGPWGGYPGGWGGYPGWGGYGSSKAALEHLSAILAAENPAWRVYWVDPGDMRTQMHQEAYPDEDISDRPLPEVSVPGFIALLEGNYPSGRYQARNLGGEPAPLQAVSTEARA